MDGCEYELIFKIKSTDESLSMAFFEKLKFDEDTTHNSADTIYNFRSTRPDIIGRTVVTGSIDGSYQSVSIGKGGIRGDSKEDAEAVFSRSPESSDARREIIRKNQDLLRGGIDIIMDLEREDAFYRNNTER